jgi:hypothetical protein
VSKIEELRKQYAEFRRELDLLKEKAPKDMRIKIDVFEFAYGPEYNAITISREIDGCSSYMGGFSAEDGEKLYQFLGGLYGE